MASSIPTASASVFIARVTAEMQAGGSAHSKGWTEFQARCAGADQQALLLAVDPALLLGFWSRGMLTQEERVLLIRAEDESQLTHLRVNTDRKGCLSAPGDSRGVRRQAERRQQQYGNTP